MVEVAVIEHGQVLCLESRDVLLQLEIADLLDDAVLLRSVKEEIEVNGEGLDVLVVIEDLLEELIPKLVKEIQGLLRYPDLLRSLEELDRLETDLLELDHSSGVDSLA